MGFSWSEREGRAAKELKRQKGRVDFMSVNTEIEILQLVARDKSREETEAEEKMRLIAEIDRANEERKKLRAAAVQALPPVVEVYPSSDIDIAIDMANKRRQKRLVGKQPDRSHPIIKQEIIPERRLERELRPKPRKPPKEDWKKEATKSSAWKRALEWFKMTPQQQAAAEAAIENKMNLEDGLVGQTLALQAEWEKSAEDGWPESHDSDG